MRADKGQMTATVGRWALVVALIFTMGALTACDRLLSVNLPTAVTSGAFDNPGTADIQVNSVMALVECGYSGLALDASGNEDNFERYSGSAGSYEEYNDTPVGGECDPDNPYSHQWVDAMLTARAEGYNTYDRIGNWTDAEVSDREKLLAEDALYTAVALDVFGEYFCDFAIDAGPMMTPDMTLDTAAVWVDRALSHIGNTGDFAIDVQNGEVTPSIEQMAHGLKARARPTGLSPAAVRRSRRLGSVRIFSACHGPTTPTGGPIGLGWSPFARRY